MSIGTCRLTVEIIQGDTEVSGVGIPDPEWQEQKLCVY